MKSTGRGKKTFYKPELPRILRLGKDEECQAGQENVLQTRIAPNFESRQG